MTIMARHRVLGIATEATAGTLESLDGTDAVYNAYNINIVPTQALEVREAEGGEYAASATAGTEATVTFTTDVRHNGTDIPVWATNLLPACGWVNNSGTFKPTLEGPGANVKTVSIGVWTGGKYESVYGAMGDFEIIFPATKTAYINWTFRGTYSGESAEAMPVPTGTSVVALKANSMTTTFDSVVMCIQQASIRSNNNLYLKECLNAASFSHSIATDRQPLIQANPESVGTATQNRITQWKNGVEASLVFAIGSAITFTAPKAQIQSITRGDREKLVIDDIVWQCNKNGTTANESLTIAFS